MKIWSKMFLVAATGMMMFSSCLETIEPEGLNDLRGAKADLLRAETALVEAKAARENAEAALLQAKAKVEEAIAAQEAAKVAYYEAEALLMQYKAEYQALVNAAYEAEKAFELEQKIAAAEAAKAQAEIDAQKAAADLEYYLLQVQTNIVKAQAAYERALKDLAVSKVALTKSQVRYLKRFWAAVDEAETAVDEAEAAFETASDELAKALKFVENNKKYAIRWAEGKVAEAEATLEGALEAVKIAEEALEIDPTIVDWVEMRAELEAEKKAIEEKGMAAYVDGEYAELYATLYDEDEGLVTKAKEYEDYTGYTFDEETGKFVEPVFPVKATTLTPIEYPAVYVPSPKDEEGEYLFTEMGDFILEAYTAEVEESDPETMADEEETTPMVYYGDASAVLDVFDAEIEKYATINAEDYEAKIAGNLYQIKAIEKDSEDQLAQYEAAVAAYKAGDVVSYLEEYVKVWTGETDVNNEPINADYDVETAVEEYNTAMNAFVAALEKYNTEWAERAPASIDETAKELLEVYNGAIADAEAEKLYDYQVARDTYYEASITWQNAKLAYERAKDIRDAKINALLETAGYKTVEELETAIAEYLADKAEADENEDDTFDSDGALKATYNKNLAYKADIDKANKDFDDEDDTTATDPQSVYDAASKVWEKAKETYNAEIATADKTYNDTKSAAKKEYDEAIENLNVGLDQDDPDYVDPMEADYFTSLYREFYAAYNNYAEKYYAVNRHARVAVENVEMIVGAEEEKLYFKFENIPSYLVDEKTQAPKEIKVADIIDKEYFLATTVKTLADNYAAKVHIFGFYAYNAETETRYFWLPVVIGAPADYPLSLPTYESYTKALEAFDGDPKKYADEEYRKLSNECIASGGSAEQYDYEVKYADTPLDGIFYLMLKNEMLEENIANVAVAAEHVKTLEAAKAEFEAYVAEAEAAIDEIAAEVEASWAEVYPKYAELEEARVTAMARYAEVKATITRITDAVNLYIFNNFPTDEDAETETAAETEGEESVAPEIPDYEEFVEALQAAYDKAVKAVDEAEFNLENAKEMLTKIENDEVGILEYAQKEFDDAKADLDEALAELAEAAEELEKAMAAIGEGTVEEDTPATEETPAE